MRIKLANARTNRANILRKLGRMEDAWSELNQAIRIDPKSANAYNNRAFWYLSANEVERALVDVNWAISLNPALYQAYVTRSSAYIKQRKWEAALADINLVLQAAPDYPGRVELFNNKGLLHMQLGQRNAALISFTTGCLAGDQRQCQFVSKLKQLR
jgi:tetratricopeptide (TPR) repeat protein